MDYKIFDNKRYVRFLPKSFEDGYVHYLLNAISRFERTDNKVAFFANIQGVTDNYAKPIERAEKYVMAQVATMEKYNDCNFDDLHIEMVRADSDGNIIVQFNANLIYKYWEKENGVIQWEQIADFWQEVQENDFGE